jgi:hypothetical protein
MRLLRKIYDFLFTPTIQAPPKKMSRMEVRLHLREERLRREAVDKGTK